MYICSAYSAALMEDIRYQPPLRAMEPSFFAYGTFWHSIMSLSFIVIPICIYVPYPTLLLSYSIPSGWNISLWKKESYIRQLHVRFLMVEDVVA